MEHKKLKLRYVLGTMGTVVFISVFLLNISIFAKTGTSNTETSMGELLSQASALDESGSSLK